MKGSAVKIKNFHHKKVAEKLSLLETESYHPNEETIKAIEEAEKGIGLSRTFDTVAEVMEALDAEN